MICSCVGATPAGTGSSPIRIAPAIPFGTCFTASWCEWYMPTVGVDCATKLYVYVVPGVIGACVMCGTPSCGLGLVSPWKWMAVDSGSSLCRTNDTLSPGFTRIVGPGTVPLNVHAFTVLPLETSQSTIFAVRSNCLVPSASTVGSSGCAPRPDVACGNAEIEAFIAASISSDDISCVAGGAAPVGAAAPLAATTFSDAF